MLVALDKFGRMVLPKPIRDDLGLRPGDKLEALEEDDHVVLRPCREDALIKAEGGVLVYSGRSTEDLSHTVEQNREQRLRKLMDGSENE